MIVVPLRGTPTKKMGRDTLKFWVSDGDFTYQAIGFGMAEFYDSVANAKAIDLAYSLSFDNWQGNENIQLDIKDINLTKF